MPLKNHCNRQSSLNWQLCIVVHDHHRFSCLRRMGLEINVKTIERMKWGILESSSFLCLWFSRHRGWSTWNVGLSHIVLNKLLAFQKFVGWSACETPVLMKQGLTQGQRFLLLERGCDVRFHQPPSCSYSCLGELHPLFYLWYLQYLKYSNVRFFLLID